MDELPIELLASEVGYAVNFTSIDSCRDTLKRVYQRTLSGNHDLQKLAKAQLTTEEINIWYLYEHSNRGKLEKSGKIFSFTCETGFSVYGKVEYFTHKRKKFIVIEKGELSSEISSNNLAQMYCYARMLNSHSSDFVQYKNSNLKTFRLTKENYNRRFANCLWGRLIVFTDTVRELQSGEKVFDVCFNDMLEKFNSYNFFYSFKLKCRHHYLGTNLFILSIISRNIT